MNIEKTFLTALNLIFLTAFTGIDFSNQYNFFEKGDPDSTPNQEKIDLQEDSAVLRPVFAGQQHGIVSLNKARSADQIEIRKPEGFSFPDAEFEITQYRWAFIPEKEGESNHRAAVTVKSGAQISDQLKKRLKDARDGDRLIFDLIKVKGPKGERNLQTGISVTLKAS